MDNICKTDLENFKKELARDYERLLTREEKTPDGILFLNIQRQKKRLDSLTRVLASAELYIEYLEKYIAQMDRLNKRP